MENTKSMVVNIEVLVGLGVREAKANRMHKAISKWNGKKELGQGIMYTTFRNLGSSPPEALIVEAIYWGLYDIANPPTPWELGLMNFVEGKSKLKYNQIRLI